MKKYFCDLCGTEVWYLYSIMLDDGDTIDLCRACFYSQTQDQQFKS